ncbi:hypothetical protein [Mesorhizobium sp. INR15]|uniref:hypothetical protein n=1 Tax=Mesorhizobium sp. INR15 TaxID=2654248 RepID=UPI001896550D|nr:hypothetical protein [Mesorhizobium sp. INR15]QPC92018.1 hypothetical protein GA829_16300 [Mesorhizobium sp. INR15]
MTRRLQFLAALAFATLSVSTAQAKAPADVADLVGARAPGAETAMQSRGYTNVKNNNWWNDGSKICVKVKVSQGKYASIAKVAASSCGQGGKSAAK